MGFIFVGRLALEARCPSHLAGFSGVRKVSIHSQLQHIIDHARKEHPEEGRAFFETRICVYFNQPHREVLIHKEIVAEQFEAVLSVVSVELPADGVHGLHHQHLHVLHQVSVHIHLHPPIVVVLDILLEVLE